MKHPCFLLSALLLSSCGYRHQSSDSSGSIAIHLPYVRGDYEGRLTQELMRELAAVGIELCESSSARYLLEVAIVKEQTDQIGYEYDREVLSAQIADRLLANEARRTVTATVSLRDQTTGELLFGPEEVSGEGEYDYLNGDSVTFYGFIDSEGMPTSVLQFSLGQLDSVDGASTDVLTHAYRLLSQRLASGLLRVMDSCQSRQ